MKSYKEYMDRITVPGPLHQKLVSRASEKGTAGEAFKSPAQGTENRRRGRVAAFRRYAAAFASLAVVLVCICATPHLWKKTASSDGQPDNTGSLLPDGSLSEPFSAPSDEPSVGSFTISKAGSDPTAGNGETQGDIQHNGVPHVSDQGGDPSASDVSVKYITEPDGPDSGPFGISTVSRNDLGLDEARADADFGAYLPKSVPSGFAFESAVRFTDNERDFLRVLWTRGMDEILWSVSRLEEKDKARITSVADRENYDLALYPAPRAGSVPEELREIVDDPIFRIEDLTLDAVKARSVEVADAGDIPSPRMSFSVLYGDILVKLNVKGASPEEIYDILKGIGASL
mgnify:FL=1